MDSDTHMKDILHLSLTNQIHILHIFTHLLIFIGNKHQYFLHSYFLKIMNKCQEKKIF